jgi:hypothetical protein
MRIPKEEGAPAPKAVGGAGVRSEGIMEKSEGIRE